jgi:hypothetical protein
MAKSKPKLKFPDRKISATFLQFAEPLLDAHGPNLTEAQMEQPLRIAWTVWNAVVYADAGGNARILGGVRTSTGHNPQLKGFIEALIDHKRTVFGDDHRLIGEYKLFRKDGEIRLRAEARDPASSQQSS